MLGIRALKTVINLHFHWTSVNTWYSFKKWSKALLLGQWDIGWDGHVWDKEIFIYRERLSFFLEQYLMLPLQNDNAVCSLPYDLLLVNPSHLFSVPVAAYKHCKASKMKRSSGMSFITDLCKCESRNVCWFIAAC